MVNPKKHLGQHFLRDENIARKIAELVNPDYPLVLEIGPGTGVLSKYLLQDKRLDPWFMEIDRESVAYLTNTYPEMTDRLIQADFLKYDLERFPAQGQKTKFSVIGNFPYNISTQILFRVLENRDRIPEVTGMFQKEVAERIAAPPGNKTYGIISVLLQAFYHIDYLFTVSETVFFPPPKVKSAVIRLRRNDTTTLDCDESLFVRVVKTGFNQRRKTLRNSLGTMTRKPLGPYSGLRPERLGVADFVALTRILQDDSSENFLPLHKFGPPDETTEG
jgi:16S rRNA (adenine1518-N6/adenine1519-N6)-dimethyltransferase